ncbi:hypothetical protein PR048_005243 [Dryococelus australis]|uniref:Uncharacterized protein n=1 Tax=Dryococelus australis TaxID=614101 RepID=A0ABQ9I7N8_9NEOP|nr:hypothetical protein PR048_005243 [Dryococelus australis]
MEQHRKARGGGNWNSPRKPADRQHRPARFPRAEMRGDPTGNRTRFALISGDVEPMIQRKRSKMQELNLAAKSFVIVQGPAVEDIQAVYVSVDKLLYKLARITHYSTVAELFASHQGDPGSIPAPVTPDFCMWESYHTMLLVGGFPRGSPVSATLSFRRCSIHTSIPLIGSEDLNAFVSQQGIWLDQEGKSIWLDQKHLVGPTRHLVGHNINQGIWLEQARNLVGPTRHLVRPSKAFGWSKQGIWLEQTNTTHNQEIRTLAILLEASPALSHRTPVHDSIHNYSRELHAVGSAGSSRHGPFAQGNFGCRAGEGNYTGYDSEMIRDRR